MRSLSLLLVLIFAASSPAAPLDPPEVGPYRPVPEAMVQVEDFAGPAGELEIEGRLDFRPKPGRDAAVPERIEAIDATGKVASEAKLERDGTFRLELPAAGIFRLNPAPSDGQGWRDQDPAWVFRGDWAQAVEGVRQLAEPALVRAKSESAAATGDARAALERRMAVLRFALHWVDQVSTPPQPLDLPEFAYLARALPEVARGVDVMTAGDLASHLALIEIPEPEDGPEFVRTWVHVPAHYDASRSWPLAIFLHGNVRNRRQMIEDFRGPVAAFPDGEGMPLVALAPRA